MIYKVMVTNSNTKKENVKKEERENQDQVPREKVLLAKEIEKEWSVKHNREILGRKNSHRG